MKALGTLYLIECFPARIIQKPIHLLLLLIGECVHLGVLLRVDERILHLLVAVRVLQIRLGHRHLLRLPTLDLLTPCVYILLFIIVSILVETVGVASRGQVGDEQIAGVRGFDDLRTADLLVDHHEAARRGVHHGLLLAGVMRVVVRDRRGQTVRYISA